MYPQFCKYIYNTMKSGIQRCLKDSLFCLHFNGHFPGEPELASVYWSKGWWRWRWQLDYWSYKSCKAPVNSSPPTNKHPVFLQAGCPSCCPTNSIKALKGKITHYMDLLTQTHLGSSNLSLTTNSSWLLWLAIIWWRLLPSSTSPGIAQTIFAVTSRWREDWQSATVVNSTLVVDPTIRLPGLIFTSVSGRCWIIYRPVSATVMRSTRKGFNSNELCDCGEI